MIWIRLFWFLLIMNLFIFNQMEWRWSHGTYQSPPLNVAGRVKPKLSNIKRSTRKSLAQASSSTVFFFWPHENCISSLCTAWRLRHVLCLWQTPCGHFNFILVFQVVCSCRHYNIALPPGSAFIVVLLLPSRPPCVEVGMRSVLGFLVLVWKSKSFLIHYLCNAVVWK